MPNSVNRAILIGFVGKDPKINRRGDSVMATFSIATNEHWKDRRSGERKEKTEWHNIAAFGPAATVAERFVRKGSKVYIEGKIETRKWHDRQTGQDRFMTQIVVPNFGGQLTLLDARQDGDSSAWQEAKDLPQSQQESFSGYEEPSRSSAEDDVGIPF